jgi:hypothetical protein
MNTILEGRRLFMADFVVTGTIGAVWGAFVILTLIRILARCIYPPIRLMDIVWPPKKARQ